MNDRRPAVEVTLEGRTWRLIDAGRAPSGLGLGYFLPADGGEGDLRVALEPDADVASLSPEALDSLWREGAPLTATEKRFTDAGGDLWLAQSTGPVWAAAGAAADAVGIRLRCLTSDRPPVSRTGRTLETLSDEDLVALTRQEPEPGADETEEG